MTTPIVTHFKKKRNLRGRLLLHAVGAFILIISVVLVIANIKMYQKRQELATQIENLKNKIEEIKAKNDTLQQGISKANDDQYIEKIAREELALQKPGEKVVSFITPQAPHQGADATEKNFIQVWLGWISALFFNNHSTAN